MWGYSAHRTEYAIGEYGVFGFLSPLPAGVVPSSLHLFELFFYILFLLWDDLLYVSSGLGSSGSNTYLRDNTSIFLHSELCQDANNAFVFSISSSMLYRLRITYQLTIPPKLPTRTFFMTPFLSTIYHAFCFLFARITIFLGTFLLGSVWNVTHLFC